MKRTLLGVVFVSLVLVAAWTFASEQTWSGEISDSACGAEHQPIGEGNPVLPSPECVKVCLRGGSKYVFVVDDKVYDIENQKLPDLEKYAGQPVKVTGEMTGKSLTISRIEPN